ncbi:MAG: transglycosylase SLT domain-containing protein [Hyphomonadaceae bacterium]|nr:transglycosylase SLT domain-containing protein [Hyphomonadaceae bacterium]MBX3509776.1 transglycosylase SLT domain-containing protein [Hyphomonadaceae bacterium]
MTNDRPDNPGDACEIFRDQSGWWRSARSAERRWGAPPALQLAIIRQESGFRHNARPARGRGFLFFPGARPSSAHGYAQALSSTWAEYERARGDSGVDRNEFSDATDFVSWYCAGTQRELGIPFHDARSHYLAYHEGRGGYRRGTYNGNGTLLAAAARVQSYYDTYAGQLRRCEGRLNRWWSPF